MPDADRTLPPFMRKPAVAMATIIKEVIRAPQASIEQGTQNCHMDRTSGGRCSNQPASGRLHTAVSAVHQRLGASQYIVVIFRWPRSRGHGALRHALSMSRPRV